MLLCGGREISTTAGREEGRDEHARNTTVPGVFEVFERETTVLCVGLLALERVLGPDAS